MALTKKSRGRVQWQLLRSQLRVTHHHHRGNWQSVSSAATRILPLPRVDPSILSIFEPLADSSDPNENTSPLPPRLPSSDLSWYLPWLAQQVETLPRCLTNLITSGSTTPVVDLSLNSALYQIFMAINECVRQGSSLCIDEIIEHLQASVVEFPVGEPEIFSTLRLLVFTILGWQSMLYLPSFNTCSLRELAIYHPTSQPDSGLVFDTFKLSADLADRPMAIILKGYGNLLPARSRRLAIVASEASEVASLWCPVNPAEFNAHLLYTLLRIEIRWVDTLALHLDYDKSTRTLLLFRYPSLCTAMLRSKGALYSFASTDLNSADPRADHNEITDILHEVVLSYRLLFGQSKHSRKLFQHLSDSNPTLYLNADPFLYSLCAKKHPDHYLTPQDRSTYSVHHDFPVLGERITLLGRELKGTKPKTWMDLIRDRRDTTQYWTFWLVAMIGGASISLSFIQVILQGIQMARS